MTHTRTVAAMFGLAFSFSMIAAPAQAQTVTQVMSGLDSPRGLAFGPEGGLYVTEAGVPVNSGFCVPVALGNNCYSETGKVSRLFKGQQERVVEGLPSLFNSVRQDVVGANDISFQGRGGAYITLGWGGAPAARAALGEPASLVGTLIKLEPSGHWRVDADISAFEGANNPAGGPIDSNPYGVLAGPGERYVTDAGGNSLLRVAANGKVSLITTFAAIGTSDAVPTEVNVGPDGALYVSVLTGVPFTAGAAKIYRVVPGQANQIFQDGFRTIIDFAWGPDGSLYVLEHSIPAPLPNFSQGPGASQRSHRTTSATSSAPPPSSSRARPQSPLTMTARSTYRTGAQAPGWCGRGVEDLES